MARAKSKRKSPEKKESPTRKKSKRESPVSKTAKKEKQIDPKQSAKKKHRAPKEPRSYFEDIKEHLRNESASLFHKTDIFSAKRDTLFVDVFSNMQEKNVFALPVVNGDNKLAGLIDLKMVTSFILDTYCTKEKGDAQEMDVYELKPSETRLKVFLETLPKETVSAVMSYGNKAVPSFYSWDFFDAYSYVKILSRIDQNRLFLINATGQVRGLVTLSNVLKSIVKYNTSHTTRYKDLTRQVNKENFPSLYSEFDLKKYTVSEETTALQALAQMKFHGIEGLAILNKENKITGHFSYRDIKGVHYSTSGIQELNKSVKKFKEVVKRVRKNLPIHKETDSTPRNIVVLIDGTKSFKKALALLADKQLHQVFIVNNNKEKKPVALLTIRKALQLVVTEPEAEHDASEQKTMETETPTPMETELEITAASAHAHAQPKEKIITAKKMSTLVSPVTTSSTATTTTTTTATTLTSPTTATSKITTTTAATTTSEQSTTTTVGNGSKKKGNGKKE